MIRMVIIALLAGALVWDEVTIHDLRKRLTTKELPTTTRCQEYEQLTLSQTVVDTVNNTLNCVYTSARGKK